MKPVKVEFYLFSLMRSMHHFDTLTKLTSCLDTPFIGYLCGQEAGKIIPVRS